MHCTTSRFWYSTSFESTVNCDFATLWRHSNIQILIHRVFCAHVHKLMQDLTEIWDVGVKRFGIWVFLKIWDWDLRSRFEILFEDLGFGMQDLIWDLPITGDGMRVLLDVPLVRHYFVLLTWQWHVQLVWVHSTCATNSTVCHCGWVSSTLDSIRSLHDYSTMLSWLVLHGTNSTPWYC